MANTKLSALPTETTFTGSDFMVKIKAGAAGDVKILLSDFLLAISPAWASWTPTLTNLTLGNGTMTAKYMQLGKMVFYRFVFTLGTTSAVGTGPMFTLPVTPNSIGGSGSGSIPIGTAHYEDNGVNSYEGMVYISAATPTTTATLVLSSVSGAYIVGSSVSATAPHTWGSTDEIRAQGFYEAA